MSESEVRVVIDGYRDLVRVGSGGFSMVYRAHQEAFDRTVAVKVLTVELVDENAQRRFQRECRASGRLSNHPNVVTVLDSGFTADGRPFITTEFMSHGSLADRLEEQGPYPVPQVLDIGVKMAGALAAVHAAGILHRDIKPQNILISDYDEPALADFGISAITVGPDASIGTSSITPLHVAPEVLEGQPTSYASDVYALGSTLYTLLADRAPFQQGEEDALLPLMRRVVMDPVPPIDRPDMPGPVLDLLRYSMEKQPFARYPTAVAFGEAIQALQAHLGLAVTPLRHPGATTGTVPVIVADVPDGSAAVTPGDPIPDPVRDPIPAAVAGSSRTPLVVGIIAVVAVVAIIGAVIAGKASSTSSSADATASTVAPKAAGGGSPGSSAPTTAAGDGSGDPNAAAPMNLRFDVDQANLDTTPASAGGTLKVALDTEPASWNPATSRFYGGSDLVATAIFEPLTVLTADGAKPYLARAVTHNEAFDEWTIEIPTGVTFHDGSALTPDAVKANFDARLGNDLMAPLLAPVSGVTVDGARVVVKTRQPWPSLPVALAGEAGLIAAPASLTDDGTHPVGTGPFAFTSWEPGQKIVVAKNAAYRVPGQPVLEGIEFSVIPDPQVRRQALESGAVDLLTSNDPVTVDELAGPDAVLQAKTASVATLVFNVSAAPLTDVRLRRALAAAIDRGRVVDLLFGSKAPIAESPFAPASLWAHADTQTQAFDQDNAKQFLAEYTKAAGPAPTVELLVGTSEKQTSLAQLVQEQWAAIGVTTTIKSVDDSLTPIVDGTYQVALWTFDVPTDPDELYRWFHTDPIAGDYTYNLTRLSDPVVDKAFDKGRRAAVPNERQVAYAAVEQGLVDQSPVVWLAYLPSALIASPRVVGWTPDTMGGIDRGGTPWANQIGFK